MDASLAIRTACAHGRIDRLLFWGTLEREEMFQPILELIRGSHALRFRGALLVDDGDEHWKITTPDLLHNILGVIVRYL